MVFGFGRDGSGFVTLFKPTDAVHKTFCSRSRPVACACFFVTLVRGPVARHVRSYIRRVDGRVVIQIGKFPCGRAVGNESIGATAITAIGGKGQVTILNAGGKKAVVANVLGQVIANTVISSDNATFPASAGMVVVTLEDGTVLKAMVK